VDAVTHFCRDVLPRIRAEVPRVTLTIAGGEPAPAVRRLAAEPGVSVTGFVDRLEPYYGRATVFVAPLRIAGGIAGKTVDALAAGCPVVTTSIGGEGLGVVAGEHLLVADGAEAFAAEVVRLLRDPALRRRLGEAARRFAEERYAPAVSAATLEREHQALVTGRSGATRPAGP
jgi:glycosyltransferase involved in cell wall biosynthesis